MFPRTVRFALLLSASILCGSGANRLHAEEGAPTAGEFMAAGDRSARKGKLIEALDAWKRAFERRFGGFREKVFLYPVEAAYLDQAGLRDKILDEFQKELPDEKLLAQQKTLAAFGFVPADFDLKATLIELYSSEIAGFYDPDTKKLYLIRETKEKERSWLERLLDSGGSAEEQKVTLIHEMSHALMDQHHDLYSLHRSVEHDDDMALALGALIEGEATLAMLVGPQGEAGKSLLRASPHGMRALFSIITPFLGFAGGPAFRRAPGILKESLIFPYLQGMVFCMTLTHQVGVWKPVDAAFSAPPVSTEQILHPEKYGRDEPQTLSFPDLTETLGPGWKQHQANVLGEFAIQILLSMKLPRLRADRAAAGWDGDFFRVLERAEAGARPSKEPSPALLLAWATTWDDVQEALEFRREMAAFQEALRGEKPIEEDITEPGGPIRASRWESRGSRAAVFQRETEVWWLDGVPNEAFEAVLRRCLELKKAPKTLQFRRAKPQIEFDERRRLRVDRL